VLYAVLDEVVDEYVPVDAGLENDIDEIEEQLFSGDPEVTRRIYDLASEVMEFQRATRRSSACSTRSSAASRSTASSSSCSGTSAT
jgi:Mg2+ and Co2+ transporter CorA